MTLSKTAFLAAAIGLSALSPALAGNVKFAVIDPQSGPFGPMGEGAWRHVQFSANKINEAGGLNGDTIETMVFDNKVNPQESLVQLQKAIDAGARYIVQGNGSSVAGALIEAIDKFNARNPGDEVLFINYAAVDPAFTNEKCSYWHFRFDANADMKMNALTDWVKANPGTAKVYLIGQDYSFGHAVHAAAEKMLGEKTPDIQIVGNEFTPLGKVTDFTPYVQKIINSGADTVITGNWGQDLVLLVRAIADSGADLKVLTYYGGSKGAPTAVGAGAAGKLFQISEANTNIETTPEQDAYIDEFTRAVPDYDYYYHRISMTFDMLAMAAKEAGSSDPVAVARALEHIAYDGPYGPVYMRADDHQVHQPLVMSVFAENPPRRGVEGLPLGWVSGKGDRVDAKATELPTTCQMKRPD